ncbi:MAG: hypothetical protein ACD_62C00432G0001 [uncultured bacterium]|nr:MAG: hypothetical protein ACD_62C00432G0001 [uncultured bacterium]
MSTADNVNLVKARAVGNAGLQRALNQLNNGLSPAITDMTFGPGKFSTTVDAESSLVTVVAEVGKAKVTQSINADFAQNCCDLIVEETYAVGNVIKNVKIEKLCNVQAILSKMYVSWNSSSCATALLCDGTNSEPEAQPIYEDVGTPPNNKIWICHNGNNPHTIAVNPNGWNGHDGHVDDYLGPCVIGEEPGSQIDIVTCEESAESQTLLSNCVQDDDGNTVVQIDMAGTTIFQAGSIPTPAAQAAGSGEEIDVANAAMTDNGNYYIDVMFAQPIAVGTWVTITTEFADASTLNKTFKLGDQPQQTEPDPVEPEEEGGEDPEPEPPADEGFEVENGIVVVDPSYQVAMQVLGSAITCGTNGPEVNVAAELCTNNSCSALWQNSDLDGGETYTTTNDQPGSEYKIRAHAYLNSCANFSRYVESTDTLHVKSLVNGQQAPALAGFGGQQSVQSFLSNYLNDAGVVTIDPDQVIMLFELGTNLNTNPNSTAADFQDLVILMTISEVE